MSWLVALMSINFQCNARQVAINGQFPGGPARELGARSGKPWLDDTFLRSA